MDRDFIKDDQKFEAGAESENENSQESQSNNNEEASRVLGEIIKDFQRNTSQVRKQIFEDELNHDRHKHDCWVL